MFDDTNSAGGPSRSGRRKIELLDLDKWGDDIPEIQWIVKDWLAVEEVLLVAGAPKTGKTTTLVDLILHLAVGRDWMGYTVDKPWRVLIIDEEQGVRTTYRLIRRLAKGLGEEVAPWQGDEDAHLWAAVGQGITIASVEGIEELEGLIDQLRPDVVMLDSLAKVTAGQSENENALLAEIYRGLLRLRNKYKTGFILSHHVTKAAMGKHVKPEDRMARIRGGGEHVGNADAVIWTERPPGKPLEFSLLVRRESDVEELPGILIEREVSSDGVGPVVLKLAGKVSQEPDFGPEQATLQALADGPLSAKELNERVLQQCGKTASTAGRARTSLKDAGLVETPRNGLWQLTEEGRRRVQANKN